MIRKTIFCVCLIMLLARCGYGANIFGDENGNDWQKSHEVEKLSFALGFIQGVNYVVDQNMNKSMQFLNKLRTEKGEKVSEFLKGSEEEEKSRNSFLQRYAIYYVSARQIVEGTDILYKDFKNKGIKINDAIYVVKRQIEGTSPEDIEKILIYLRSNYENVESLITRDKNGGVINSIQFP